MPKVKVESKMIKVEEVFDCPAGCKAGLINPSKVCGVCNGTGKANPQANIGLGFEPSDYPAGTNVITLQGTYLINEKGEAIKQ